MSVSFGDSIRRGREIAGLSQAKVAHLIGKSPSTVRSWEMGRTSPSEPAAVSALAAVLGIDEPTLLSRAGFEQTEAPSRLTLEQELEALTISDPTPIPAPPKPESQPKAKRSIERFAFPGLRQGPPRHLVPKGIELQPMPPLLAAAAAQDVVEADAETPISITVVPTATPTRRERKVTMIPAKASPVARSYVEDTEQREFYRWRTIATLVLLFVLYLAFWWALRNMGSAISDFFGGFIDQLNF
jgi:transcriptional regulator with XRE-family HTH domain